MGFGMHGVVFGWAIFALVLIGLEMLAPGAFTIEAAFGEGPHAALHGTLRHTSRQTGKPFASDWALVCEVRGGRIVLYHFFEDTEALREAITA